MVGVVIKDYVIVIKDHGIKYKKDGKGGGGRSGCRCLRLRLGRRLVTCLPKLHSAASSVVVVSSDFLVQPRPSLVLS